MNSVSAVFRWAVLKRCNFAGFTNFYYTGLTSWPETRSQFASYCTSSLFCLFTDVDMIWSTDTGIESLKASSILLSVQNITWCLAKLKIFSLVLKEKECFTSWIYTINDFKDQHYIKDTNRKIISYCTGYKMLLLCVPLLAASSLPKKVEDDTTKSGEWNSITVCEIFLGFIFKFSPNTCISVDSCLILFWMRTSKFL